MRLSSKTRKVSRTFCQLAPKWAGWAAAIFFIFHANFASADSGKIVHPEAFSLNGNTFYAERECKPAIERLGLLMHEYDTAGYNNESVQAKAVHLQIQAELAKIAPTDPCYTWVYGAEALYSINLFNRYANDRAEVVMELALPLYAAHKLLPLTSALREEWGGSWVRPHYVMGSYECEKTLIYFDPTVAPYNLGGVIAHEIEHFMHDKYTFTEINPAPNISAALFLDELTASLKAGYFQFAFQRDMIRHEPDETAPSLLNLGNTGFYFQKRRAFRLRFDLDLFKKRGHLYHLWTETVKKNGVKLGAFFTDFFESTIYPDFLEEAENKRGQFWGPIFELTNAGYFENQGPSKESVASLLKEWHSTHPELILPSESLFVRTSTETKRGDSEAWNRFWDDFNFRLEKTSASCLDVKKAIREGRVGGYVGTQLGGDLPEGGDGHRPSGGDGHRPSGGDGHRPSGGEGHRPDLPLLPCLFPDEGL